MDMKFVVGVDGSEHSRRAVEWCATYAKLLGAEVVAVHAIDIPFLDTPPTAFPVRIPEFSSEERADLKDVASSEWCAPLAKARVSFRVVLVDGVPAQALMQAAQDEDANLVVTGKRGRGGFAELILGSTSHALSLHLNRPLVIVP
jgi:nucleotide-binding universal stress UspA family protein